MQMHAKIKRKMVQNSGKFIGSEDSNKFIVMNVNVC